MCYLSVSHCERKEQRRWERYQAVLFDSPHEGHMGAALLQYLQNISELVVVPNHLKGTTK
jgi:hypothetical protein